MTKKNIENDTTMCSTCLLKLSYIIARMEKIESALYCIEIYRIINRPVN